MNTRALREQRRAPTRDGVPPRVLVMTHCIKTIQRANATRTRVAYYTVLYYVTEPASPGGSSAWLQNARRRVGRRQTPPLVGSSAPAEGRGSGVSTGPQFVRRVVCPGAWPRLSERHLGACAEALPVNREPSAGVRPALDSRGEDVGGDGHHAQAGVPTKAGAHAIPAG